MAPDALGPARAEKERLRRSMRELRSSLRGEERARRAAEAERTLLGLTELSAARTVLLFYAFGSELPTRGIAARILDSGKRVLLPFREQGGRMEAAEISPGQPLEATAYGPREPSARVAVDPNEIDLVVAPGLAFDRHGNRLGYGGGHYDRYLARLGPHAVRVGLAFSIQLVERVPVEPGDERVDIVVTDEGALDVRPVQ